MQEEYDYIVLGTGLKECVLSGLLSVDKNKVLHMDRNDYYGGDSASLNLEQLYKKFRPDQKMDELEAKFGRSRDYNIDLCPKFIMACGKMVKILLHTQVTRYLEFKSVDGSFVYKDGSVHKVPSTAQEALSSSLMGFFQKRRFKNYLTFVQNYDHADEKTYDGNDLTKMTNRQLFEKYSCDENTMAFTGHAMALYLDDNYLNQPALECVERIKLYAYSMSRYGSSPYIYPNWGLGGLPEGFSRLSAIHGGTYMLHKPIEEILFNDDGTVRGVKSENEEVYCKKLLADPSYILADQKTSGYLKKTGQVARMVCIMRHPINNTNNASACQIIIPAKHAKRKSDIYIAMVSHAQNVAAKGFYVVSISLKVETSNPKQEMRPALALIGKVEDAFFHVMDQYVPTGDYQSKNIFITSSYDETSHFETATTEVMRVYKDMTGKPVDLAKSAEPEDLQP